MGFLTCGIWQQHKCEQSLTPAISVPTGMGKTGQCHVVTMTVRPGNTCQTWTYVVQLVEKHWSHWSSKGYSQLCTILHHLKLLNYLLCQPPVDPRNLRQPLEAWRPHWRRLWWVPHCWPNQLLDLKALLSCQEKGGAAVPTRNRKCRSHKAWLFTRAELTQHN